MKEIIKKISQKFLELPLQMIRRQKAKSTVTQLTSHKNPRIKALGEALHETLTNSYSFEEQKWINKIEQRRSSLMNTRKEIAVIDYGAGSSTTKRSMEEMKKGVQTTATVSNICNASKSPFWATVLFKIARKIEPSSCVELGSCVGISSSYLTAALNLSFVRSFGNYTDRF